ncbi:MAG: fasciclin domain-containing protein [Candidatus Krumholzibacteria bacterium]|nr:fasciclin domain-containing protein [Candidatus Krumholzibacteria bacterium]
MKISRFAGAVVLTAIVIGSLPAMAQEHPGNTQNSKRTEHPKQAELPAAAEDDIVAVAAGAGDFKTLVAAIEAADLVETLQGKGPFTVFAPTDAAFAKLPAGTIESLLEPANKAKLAAILADHVVPGKIMAADVTTMKATNVRGRDLEITVAGGNVTVGGARVVKTDVLASNGIIHVIDSVILLDAPAQKAGAAAKPKDHPAH